MGFLGLGKKKDKSAGSSADRSSKDSAQNPSAETQRKSRRVVTAGQKPGAGSTVLVAGSERSSMPSGRPNGTATVSRNTPGAPATSRVNTSATNKGSDSLNVPVDLPADSSSDRPRTRDPIMASQPPEFSGDLSSGARRSGPARSGDAALIEFLKTKAKLIDEGQAQLIREKAGNDALPIDVAAVEIGLITEEQLVNALTQECWVPHLKVDKYEIRKKALDTISSEDASHYGVFPVDKLGSLLTLAMVNPLDADTIRVLESKTGLDIKKVVATRTEITQGIERYYGGLVQAKDASINITQDIEPKSVAQMLANVNSGTDRRPVVSAKSQPIPSPNDSSHIQDIDDLLAGDERVTPAIIEPVSLQPNEAEEFDVPIAEITELEVLSPASTSARQTFTIDSEPFGSGSIAMPTEMIAPEFLTASEFSVPAVTPARPATAASAMDRQQTYEFDQSDTAAVVPPQLDLSSTDDTMQALQILPPTKSVPKAPPKVQIAPEAKPEAKPTAKPIAPPAPVVSAAPVTRAAPVAPRTAVAPRAPVANVGTSTSASASASSRPALARPAGNKPATARFTAPNTNPNLVNLVPVMEEEFQHAITHGKSHVFEKWVGLQSRNRIINAVAVESEVSALLAGLFAAR